MKLRAASVAGFTIIETIVFVGIFAVAMGAFMSVFFSVARIQVVQSSAAEVRSQSQFLLQTVQYYVERSSLVEIPAATATTTLTLRMASSTEDPIVISLSNGTVRLQAAGGAVQNITSNKVSVADLEFVKRSNPGGPDSVAVSFTVTYATNNPTHKFSQSLRTAATRAVAATFDSNVVPSIANTYQLGVAAGDWRNINNTIYFSGSNVGIGASSPAKPLHVAGGDIYISDADAGLVLKSGVSCYRLHVDADGGLVTSSLACP